jgi:ketosteroid isomerase-like protein
MIEPTNNREVEMVKRMSLFLFFMLMIAIPPFSLAQSSMTVEQAVMHLEQERVDAMTKGDLAALDRILADDFIYTHSNARLETKPQLFDALKSGAFKYEEIRHSDLKAQVYGDTVVLRGKSDLKIKANNLPLAFQIRFLGVYVKANGRWQLTTWQSTRLEKK